MITKLVRIGNPKGVRIPKPFIEQSGLSEDIELIFKDIEIIFRSTNGPRKDWEPAFKKMAEQGDDQLMQPKIAESSTIGMRRNGHGRPYQGHNHLSWKKRSNYSGSNSNS